MAHWRKILPSENFFEIDYEAVVADLATAAHRLIDFCGLPCDDNKLRFHAKKGAVRTAAMNEVRRLIYRTSVSRSSAYRAHVIVTRLAHLHASVWYVATQRPIAASGSIDAQAGAR